jgi:hypothetical protein
MATTPPKMPRTTAIQVGKGKPLDTNGCGGRLFWSPQVYSRFNQAQCPAAPCTEQPAIARQPAWIVGFGTTSFGRAYAPSYLKTKLTTKENSHGSCKSCGASRGAKRTMHYEFEGWLGDELLESDGCFIVADRLAREIQHARLTGVSFDHVEVTTSDVFEELQPNCQLPKFEWLKIEGRPGREDFGISPGLGVVVSERALNLLRRIGLSHAATITPFEG